VIFNSYVRIHSYFVQMSISLKKLKKEREQTATLRDVGETIQRISAIHRARIENQREGVRQFRASLLEFAGESLPLEVVYPEIQKNKQKPLLFVIGPEKGLVGDLNREIAYTLERRLEWHSYKHVFVAGNRLCGFIKSTTSVEFSPYPALSDRPSRQELAEHVHTMLEGRRKDDWNVVELLYPAYESITTYKVTEKKLLPLVVRRKIATTRTTHNINQYFIEPNMEAITRRLEEMLFAAELYEVFLEARYVELSQRLLASTRATENAKRILKLLRHTYLREARGRTTRTINEIFTGRMAHAIKKRLAISS